jgi:hypothetical protein
MNSTLPSLALIGGPEILVVMVISILVAVAISVALVLFLRAIAEGRDTRRRLLKLEKECRDLQAALNGRQAKPPQ